MYDFERPSVEISEEEFQQELERMRESRATIEPVEEERALVNGDWAEISYAGQVEGDAAAPPLVGESSLVEVGGKETLEAFNTAKHTAWQTVVKVITTGFLLALVAGAIIKLKVFGGGQ